MTSAAANNPMTTLAAVPSGRAESSSEMAIAPLWWRGIDPSARRSGKHTGTGDGEDHEKGTHATGSGGVRKTRLGA
jgi:hypothetical protein